MKRIVLASTSPRRKDILNKLKLDFEIIPSSYEEVLESFDFEYSKIEALAFNKAKAVAEIINYPAIVIGADTVVVHNKTILGKPKNKNNAIEMLKKLNGSEHQVVTSICAINTANNTHKIISTTSIVKFENLSEEKIVYYVENYNPLDKAGSYGIQEMPEGYVSYIQGSLENIMGLCPQALLEVLNHFE